MVFGCIWTKWERTGVDCLFDGWNLFVQSTSTVLMCLLETGTTSGGICNVGITFRRRSVLDVDPCHVLRLRREAAKTDTVQNHKQEGLNMWTPPKKKQT